MVSWIQEGDKRYQVSSFDSLLPFHPSTPNSTALKNESKPDAVLTQLSGEEEGRGRGA